MPFGRFGILWVYMIWEHTLMHQQLEGLSSSCIKILLGEIEMIL